MGNPAEQAAAEQAAVTDGTPGLEQFDEAEDKEADTTYEVVVAGWLLSGTAEILADYLRQRAGQFPPGITIEVRPVSGASK